MKAEIRDGWAERLIADIVSANVANLATVTNRIDANHRVQIVSLAEDLIALWDIIESATVVDRLTERKLYAFGRRVDSAERTLEHTRSMQERFDK